MNEFLELGSIRRAPIGRSYYDRCEVALAEVDWADAIADEAKGKPRGLLRVNAPVSFGAHRVTPVVARYLSSHPGVDVDLILNARFANLIDEGFEAVFRIGPLGEPNLGAPKPAPSDYRLRVARISEGARDAIDRIGSGRS